MKTLTLKHIPRWARRACIAQASTTNVTAAGPTKIVRVNDPGSYDLDYYISDDVANPYATGLFILIQVARTHGTGWKPGRWYLTKSGRAFWECSVASVARACGHSYRVDGKCIKLGCPLPGHPITTSELVKIRIALKEWANERDTTGS